MWLGSVEYDAAWQLQRELVHLRAERRIGDTLLLLEHPPTITLGRGADPSHILATADELAQRGVTVHRVDRGGDVTYHGPGQLVGYPIFNLEDHRKDLHWFLRRLEEALIHALTVFGVAGRRFPPHTGVWVGEEKVAAIGIKVCRWVSMHGFALNVSDGLDFTRLIVPCGIHAYGVTTLSAAAHRSFSPVDVLPAITRAFDTCFPGSDKTPDSTPDGLSQSSLKILCKALDLPLGG